VSIVCIVVSLDRKCLGQDAEGARDCSEAFSIKETRRKALAVVSAAMELGARLGFDERRDESGSGSRSGVRCEVDVREGGSFATWLQPVMRDRAVVLR
jgi:hypothetical protein